MNGNTIHRNVLAAAVAFALAGFAANALAARVIADLDFEAVYLSGAGLTNTYLGLPDLGFVGLPEIVQHTSTIRDAVELPIIVDADTGFGNALNVRHTVRALERAGASAIQLEDQVSPKRCGHFSGKDVVPLGEARSRIRAAVDARQDPNLLILARTDARSTLGFEAAIERARAAAGDKNVGVGGTQIVQQALRAGLIDQLDIDLAPVLLGSGIRLFDDLLEPIELEIQQVIEGTGVTHISYRVCK